MGEKLTVIRTADLGADKQAEYLNIPDETNPIMGNRGIRLCLDRKRMFKAQLRAIFRASAYGNLALMYPMISSEEEMDEIEEIIREVKIGLDEKGIPYKHIKTGIMIETPAAVMISRELARRVDFLSLGTNDLSQYTLAMDRQNPLLRKKYNDHHPGSTAYDSNGDRSGTCRKQTCLYLWGTCCRYCPDRRISEDGCGLSLCSAGMYFAGKKSTETGGSVRR